MKNLREARNDAGLTQKGISDLVGISQQSYSDYENGRTFPDETTLINLANVLNVSIDYLMGRTDDLGASLPVSQKLPDDEFELLRLYRILPPEFRRSLLDSAKLWAGEPTSATDKKKA